MAKAAYIGIPNNPTVTLPSGYTQLEYIESTGTQYIDTGFAPNGNTEFEIKIEHATTSGNNYFYGGGGTWQTNALLSGVNALSYGTYGQEQTRIPTGTPQIITFKDLTLSYNGEVKTTVSSMTFQSAVNAYLFGINITATADEFFTGKIYYAKIYDNGTLIRNFVPCKNSSGTIGMYDLVNSKFYTNGGTGTFTTGTAYDGKSFARKVNKMYVGVANKPTAELPSGYTQVEYIESSGTQYIDTGFKPNQDTRMVLDCEVSTTEERALFGARVNYDNTAFSIWTTGGNIFSDYNNQYSTQTFAGGRVVIDKNKNVTTCGSVTITHANGSFQSSYNALIGTCNIKGTAHTSGLVGKIYSCQIYDNGTLIRNFIPAKNSNGTVGMYDTVNSKFYTNAGSGVFTAGTALDGKSVARKVKKAYIGVNGIARLFFGGGTLKYKGTATVLSYARSNLTGASVGDYALFAGGQGTSSYTDGISNVTDAYDSNLTRTVPTTLSANRRELVGSSVGDYALFAGGYASNKGSAVVDAYNKGLTRTTPTALNTARANLTGATVGNYALFAGGVAGEAGYVRVDTYNSSLTKGTATDLSVARGKLASTTVGDYALFAGGTFNNGYFSKVDVYDKNLTKTSASDLSEVRANLAGARVGNYAIFAGGYAGGVSNAVDIYDSNLTKIATNTLSVARYGLMATTLDGYAIFAGGTYGGGSGCDTVDVFDESLTRTTITSLSAKKFFGASATVGNYAIFAGGYVSGGTLTDIVDVYEVA